MDLIICQALGYTLRWVRVGVKPHVEQPGSNVCPLLSPRLCQAALLRVRGPWGAPAQGTATPPDSQGARHVMKAHLGHPGVT